MPTKGFSNGFGPGFGGSLNVATIALKVGPGAGYEDQDILQVFNRRQIRRVHAKHICHVRNATRNGDNLILLTHHSRDWFESTHQYRFERVSATEVKRTEIATLVEEIATDMDVVQYIALRKIEGNHFMFGEVGSEVWYGGMIDTSHAKLDLVWNAIETKTSLREVDHADWPAGVSDLKSHLMLRMNDMGDSEANAMTEQEVDESDPSNPVLVRKRKKKVAWRDLRELSPHISNIDNRNVSVDLRPSVGRLVRTIHDVTK